jgi:predicted DNA-binding ribbon-helix-helix protein
MCRVFFGQAPERYESHTRSIRLGGHATSIRLEAAFWTILEEIAEQQGVSLPRLLTKLHDEVLEYRGDVHNFTSLLRCACLTYIADIRGRPDKEAALEAEARASFGPRAGAGETGRPAAMHGAAA